MDNMQQIDGSKMLNLDKLWDSLRSSFWFVPTVMVSAALILAIALVALDRNVQIEGISLLGALIPKGTSSAGTLLSAIATSILTVTGSVFSIAIVAIQLASGQFGPRMLRDFMDDRGNQITFGTCCGTFIYAVVVLWAIEDSKDLNFTPQIAVFIGLLLTLATTFVLIYFVHHIAESVHADNLIARIGRDLEESIDRVFPEPQAKKASVRQVVEIPTDFEKQAIALRAQVSGYVQQIDFQYLLEITTQQNLMIKVLYRPGQFVVKNSPIALIQLGKNSVSSQKLQKNPEAEPEEKIEELEQQINKAFSCGNQRKPEHDVEFPVKQLVEMAIRAISPAVNDPFTAVRCIDRLSALLCYVLQKDKQSAYLFDPAGTLRLIIDPITFEMLVNAAFDQIRQYGRTDVAVTLRLLETLQTIGEQTHLEKERQALHRQADMIERGGQDASNLPEQNDRQEVLQQYNKTIRTLRPANSTLNSKISI